MSTNITVTQHSIFREYKRWLRVSLYTILILVGQCSGTMIGRLYFDKGGKSRWFAALVQSAGFPLLIPLLFYSSAHAKSTNQTNSNHSSKTNQKLLIFFSYLVLGLMFVAVDFMNAYGLSYLHLSTFALVAATRLSFTSIFTFFLNSQKFTALILNSVVVITLSVSLVAISAESEETKDLSKEKQMIGFFCTLAASATFALYNCIEQLCFEKVLQTTVFSAVLSINLFPTTIAVGVCIMGLFASGDWKTVDMEMREFENGRVSYVMTLIWTSVTWQLASIGVSGLIFEVSSLFSIVIGNLELTITPILAVIVFHDKINGVRVIAFLLAIWGFLSYMYQHYLDHHKARKDKSHVIELSKGEGQI